jgi:hypothetical protein
VLIHKVIVDIILKEDIKVLVGNVLDAFDEVNPIKILIKIKLHLLVHLPKDILHFGPAIRNSTEVFECFNGISHFLSILSNHQALSCDIVIKFVSMEHVKHMLAGGYWTDADSQTPMQAGPKVLQVLHK